MKKIKDIIKSFCIILFVLGYVSSTLYNGNNIIIANILDFLSKPFVYPPILFILGMSIYEKEYTHEKLLKSSFYSIVISLFINIVCFSIIFFIQKENDLLLEYLFKANIFTFISLTFLFMYVVKKYDINTQFLWGISLLFSIINTLLTVKCNIDSNIILGSLTSIIYSSSNYESFSFLAWIIFPITGYIYREVIEDKKDLFYLFSTFIFITIYLLMIHYSKFVVSGGPLIDFEHPFTFYHMNLYGGLMNMCLCIVIYNIVYFISKKIPAKINRHLKRWSRNIIFIYLVSILLINYPFKLLFDNLIEVNFLETIMLFAIVFIISDVISYTIEKRIIKSEN